MHAWVVAALTAVSGWAFQDSGDRAFQTRTHADFGDATLPLQEFLRASKVRATAKPQHFCVVGYESADGSDRRAWIHWSEGRKIVLWSGGTAAAIASSRRTVDLKKHVVRTEGELRGSTFLVTRAWVDGLLADCESRGERYELRRN